MFWETYVIKNSLWDQELLTFWSENIIKIFFGGGTFFRHFLIIFLQQLQVLLQQVHGVNVGNIFAWVLINFVNNFALKDWLIHKFIILENT